MNNLTAGTGDPYWYEWSVGLLYMVKMINSDSGIKNVVLQSEDSQSVYDLLNCLILDYTNCPKTAQFCVHNSPLVSPECSLRRYYFIQPIR